MDIMINHKINHFKVDISVAFSTFITLYNCFLYLVLKRFNHCKLWKLDTDSFHRTNFYLCLKIWSLYISNSGNNLFIIF